MPPPETPAGPATLPDHAGSGRRQPANPVRRIFTDRSAFLLLAQVSVALVAMLANILASRTLQASGRGELALLLQLAYLGSLGVVLGTDRSLVTVFVGAPVHEIARVQLRLLTRPAATALALGAVSVWGLPQVGLGGWRTELIVTALFLVSNAFVRSTRAVAIAGHRQHDFLVATVVEQVLLLGALALLTVAGVDAVPAWVGAYLVTALGPAAVYLAWWARRPEGVTVPVPAEAARSRLARREGLQLLPSSLANTGMLRLDRILLAAMASTAALGHYASVATFTELLTWPLIAFADNRTGAWRAQHDAAQLNVRALLLGAGAFVLAGSLLTGAFTALLLPLLGPAFAEARGLIPPLVAAAAVLGLSQIVLALLIARRRNPWASASDTTGFAVSMIAYVTLIPGHGSAGAAWGSLIGYSASLAVGLIALLVPGRLRGRWARPRLAPVVLPAPEPSRGMLSGLLLVLVALAGRYTLDRAGYASLAWIDLRVVGLVVACVLVAVEVRARGGLHGRQPTGWLIAALLLFGYQALSASWAPRGADVAAGAVDLLTLAALTTAMYLHARTWPQAAGRRLLWLLWGAGVVFGLGAFLVTGPGEQGRYAAFGGGPNVFVRIEILGLIAAVALVRTGASRHLLWSVPLLLAGALMSGSRGGLLAAAVIGLVAVVRGRATTARFAAVAGVGVAMAVTLAYRWDLPGSQLLRTRFVEQTLDEGYVSDRPAIFDGAVRLALDNPLTGAGLGGFRVLVGQRLDIEYAHNYVLSVAAEGGAIGLALLTAALVLWLRTMIQARPWDTVTTSLVAAAIFVALAGLASGDYYDSRFAWCCAAVAVAGTVAPGGTSSAQAEDEAQAEKEAQEAQAGTGTSRRPVGDQRGCRDATPRTVGDPAGVGGEVAGGTDNGAR